MKSWKPIFSLAVRSGQAEIVSARTLLRRGCSRFWEHRSRRMQRCLLTAVVLFDGPQGAAYVQITEAALNGKIEVRNCDGVSRLDKNTYNGLPRASLAGASSLQRGADGVLTLTKTASPSALSPAI
jgi:hypothetical protein